jgi:hypothetical protein
MTSVGNLKKAVCGFFSEFFYCAGLGTDFFNRVPSAGWRIREVPNRASSPKTHYHRLHR